MGAATVSLRPSKRRSSSFDDGSAVTLLATAQEPASPLPIMRPCAGTNPLCGCPGTDLGEYRAELVDLLAQSGTETRSMPNPTIAMPANASISGI